MEPNVVITSIHVNIERVEDAELADWDGSWVDDFNKGLCVPMDFRGVAKGESRGEDPVGVTIDRDLLCRPVYDQAGADEYARQLRDDLIAACKRFRNGVSEYLSFTVSYPDAAS